MTKGDGASWMVARRALDHHEAVDVLAEAISRSTAENDRPMAEQVAAELARNGLVLVRMDVEAARDFFSRREDV